MLNVIREAAERFKELDYKGPTTPSPYIDDISSVGYIGRYITMSQDERVETDEWLTDTLSLALPTLLDKNTIGETKTCLRSLGYYLNDEPTMTTDKRYLVYTFKKQKGHLS